MGMANSMAAMNAPKATASNRRFNVVISASPVRSLGQHGAVERAQVSYPRWTVPLPNSDSADDITSDGVSSER